MSCCCVYLFFFQAEDGIRDLVRSRGLGDVYKRQFSANVAEYLQEEGRDVPSRVEVEEFLEAVDHLREATDRLCLLYTSDAADERSSVDLGGRRIIKKKKKHDVDGQPDL